MKFIKIKVYRPDMDETYDLYLNLHTVVAFHKAIFNGLPCIKITLLKGVVWHAPIEEFEHLKNNVISPFCGDV